MERRSEIQDRRAGRHLRNDGLVVGRVTTGLPSMAPRKDPSRTVLGCEVDQSDHRGKLQLGFGLGHQVPHDLVPVPELVSCARQTLQQVGQIELIAGTRRSEDGIAHGHEERVDHDLGSKGGRFTRQTGDVPGLGMEDLHPRVEMTHVGVGQRDIRLDFVVNRPDDVMRQQIVNDDSTVRQERAYDSLGYLHRPEPVGVDSRELVPRAPPFDGTQSSRQYHHSTSNRPRITSWQSLPFAGSWVSHNNDNGLQDPPLRSWFSKASGVLGDLA
jgi:hypothetical protein